MLNIANESTHKAFTAARFIFEIYFILLVNICDPVIRFGKREVKFQFFLFFFRSHKRSSESEEEQEQCKTNKKTMVKFSSVFS